MCGANDAEKPGQLKQAHFIKVNTPVGVVCQTWDLPLQGVLFQSTAAVED